MSGGIDAAAGWLHRLAAFVLMPLMAAVVCVDVAARYLFSAPLQWAQDVTALALLLCFVTALPHVTMRDAHIRVETLYEKFGPRLRAASDFVSCLCGIAFTALLAYRSLADVPGMARRGEGAEMIDIPHWPIALVVGLCAAYIALLLAVRGLQAAIRLLAPAR